MLRGLGGCRFEDADRRSSASTSRPGWTTAFSATWEGTNALPTLAFGRYLVPGGDRVRRELARPAGRHPALRYAAPVALTPGLLHAVDAVQRLEPLRSRATCACRTTGTTTSTARSSSGASSPAQPPVAYTEADGWQPLQIWGMGIASQDITGDGLPEVFLTSQADNKLQTLAEGASRPDYRDIALDRGVTAQRPYAGGDVLPSTAWHPEFADVNNDGLADLLVTKGNVDAQIDQASSDPSNLFIGRAGRLVRRRCRGGRDRRLRARTRRRGRRPQPRRPARPRRRPPPRERDRCGATSVGATPRSPRRWATGSTCDCSNRRRTSTPSARGSRCEPATARRHAR